MKHNIVFTDIEIEFLKRSPEALRALADYHSVKETEADAIDPELFASFINTSISRRIELNEEADSLQDYYENN